jgi:general stress protein 26
MTTHKPSDASHKSEAQKLEQLHKIITDATAAFMVTRGSGQSLHGRPMATARVDEDLTSIWFATDRHSGKIEEISANPNVYLGYTNGSGSEWASVNGTARVVDDRAKVKELWTPLWKNWFDGPDDPRIVLIEVTPTEAEYWDSGSRLIMLAKMAAAAITGAKMSDGEHETVTVTRT